MHETDALELARRSIWVALQLILPILTLSLIVGVIISLFQAVTQIQEQTLTFVPKILLTAGALVVLGPWMLHTMVGFTAGLFAGLPSVVR